MKKLFIIGSCGAVVILILGAAGARLSGGDPKEPASFPFGKCMEKTANGADDRGCVEKLDAKDGHSELFLRAIKRKDRIAFA